MIDATRTTTILLDGLHDAENAAVWTEFDHRYRPIIIGFARRLGLGDTDAADVAQDTMTQFLKEYRQGRYDRGRGRLRTWLIALAKSRIAMVYRKRAGRREVVSDAALSHLPDDHRLSEIWEQERRTRMLRDAMKKLRESTRTSEKTIQAFEMLVVNQVPVAAVAEEMDMSVQDVYLAKSRVAQRLRGILDAIHAAYDDD